MMTAIWWSFSLDAAPPSERTRSRCPLTTVLGWDLVQDLPRRTRGALVGEVVF